MTAKELFRIWAPQGEKWVDWVRPVPFVGMKEYSKKYSFSAFTIPVRDIEYQKYERTAVIVDLPGAESVMEGIALAREGFRPVPIYNGTIEQHGARATVDNQSVGIGLLWGATWLSKIELQKDAPPAFLLDTNRLQRYKMEISLFDNSWDVYPQDLPSAEYLLKNGIEQIIIISRSLSKDLKKILFEYQKFEYQKFEYQKFEYQKKKMRILFTDGFDEPKKITIRRMFQKEKE